VTDPHLRDANELLQSAVTDTIAALDLTDKDAGAVRLAHEYAQTIDRSCSNPEILDKLGPKLLAVLEQLGATPAARAKMKAVKPPDAKPNQLAKLRAARQP
jgi:hypothetical protein